MAQRRYGPTNAAGVAIVELEGDKGIEPAQLGYAGYAGLFEKGPVGELVIAASKQTFLKKMGSYILDSQVPDAALDYYDIANGAGGLLLVRVTDGNELQAGATLYARYSGSLKPMGTIKAKNGGAWGGKQLYKTADVADAGDILNVSIDTGIATYKEDEWKGGTVVLDAVANKSYPIVGNTTAGIISVAADQTMKDDWTAAADPTNLRYYLALENAGKAVSFKVIDGQEKPDEEFGLEVYVDGTLVKTYPNLSTDPTNKRYWVSLINNDDGNDEIVVADLWTGAHDSYTRPANVYGVSSAVAETTLTAVIHEFRVTLGDALPTVALGTTTDAMKAQKITITMTSATAFDAVSDVFGALGSGVVGTAFTPNNDWAPPFTITNGTPILEIADVLQLVYKPFIAGSMIDGKLYPDKVNAKRSKFRIVGNTHKVITVADGSDLTLDGTPGDVYLVEYSEEMIGGRDGNNVVDADYQSQAWDTSNSPFNRIFNKNFGLVKFATPGVTSTSVQKAGKAYADAKNHQYRYEVPDNTVTEQGADAYVNDTLGRSDFCVVNFPSYGYVPDPLGGGEGKLKLVTLTGMIHGREARIAADYNGYHKAEAGIDAVLPKVLKLPTGDAILNEEMLNPIGISVIKKLKGNFVMWGDRTLYTDPAWKWKHQRELMSYYEHVLQENFDWIIFAINDPVTEKMAHTALKTFFIPEYSKRAIRGDSFDKACIIKIDAENNTNLTRSMGDMFAEIKLRLADTVERFIMKVGKQGIFESVG
jgi:hypothetical protein